MLSIAFPAASAVVQLPHLAVVEVQGPDAGSFLQGQLTQDVLSMHAEEARPGGFCSAKGRLLVNFVLVRPHDDTWWLITFAALREPLAKRLKMFMLRAKCTATVRADLTVWGSTAPAALAVWRVARHAGAADAADSVQQQALQIGWWGGRSLWVAPAPVQPLPGAEPNEGPADGPPGWAAWRHADVAAGWPWIEAGTVEQFVPQMINFEVLGGVNFRKGCYPGQEVVARSQYRGTLKRRMGLFDMEAATPPAAGTEIFHSEDPGQPAGLVVNAAADPASPGYCLLLAEVKLAAQETGSLHLGDAQGPLLSARTLPYRIPTESEM